MTTTPPPSRFAWNLAMWIVRPAAALTAAWSLYAVARHYGVPWQLACCAGLVYDGIAMACLFQVSEAVRAARSAALPILATIGMASASVYLNVVHAHIIGGGFPAGVLFAMPTIGLLAVSGISWATDLAAARAARGESPMRMPAFGFLGWALARQQAYDALKEQAVAHVTSGASPTHQPASALPARTAEDVIAAEFAEIGPAAAVQRVAAADPSATDAEIANILATYQVTVTPGQVALLLERAAVPNVRLDRVPQPPKPAEEHPALDPARAMRGDAPDVSGMNLADAIATMSRHLTGGDLKAEPKKVVQALALQGMATDNAYVRTAQSRAARKAEEKAAEETAAQAAKQAEYERRHGNGGFL